MTTRLPIALESLRIAAPCNADWDEMSGTDRVRFCGQCAKNVYNLSAMSRDEAEALVREKEGRVCVRLFQRRDGTVITNDCPVGTRRQRLRARVWASIAGVAASAALVLGLVSGRARADLTVGQDKRPVPKTPQGMMMGKIAPPADHTPKKKPEPKPEVKMGEPAPLMGDVSPPG